MKIFKEVQRFNQWWLITLFVLVYSVIGYKFLLFYREKETFNVDELGEQIFAGVILVLATILIFSSKLKTRIDEKGITFQFSPLQLKAKHFPWESLKKCSVRVYSPILEYGGWGFRGTLKPKLFGISKNGKAYNVRGNIGIQMIFKDGTKILIGTQDSEHARQVLNNYAYKLTEET